MRLLKIYYVKYIALLLFITLSLGYILIIGKFIIAPLLMSAFLSISLLPILNYISKYIKNNILAVVVLLFFATIIAGGLGIVIYSQFQNLARDSDVLIKGISEGLLELNSYIGSKFGFNIKMLEQITSGKGQDLVTSNSKTALSIANNLFGFLSYIILIPFYTFLILINRQTIGSKIIVLTYGLNLRYQKLVKGFSSMIQNYLKGLITVMTIMGLLNSIGLWILDVPYAFALGFIAAAFTIIPYIGVLSGSIIVMLVSYSTQGSLPTLLYIIILFAIIQILEGNFLTPVIMKTSINISPFIAILALIIGAQIWGIAGMILAIPTVASISNIYHLLRKEEIYDPLR